MAVNLPTADDIAPVGVARDPGVRADADAFGAQIGRAQQMAGQAIQNLAQVGMQLGRERQDAEDKIFFSTAESQNAIRINKQMLEAETQAPAGGEGFTQGVEQTLTTGADQLLEEMIQERGFRPSKRAMELARARFEEQKAGALVKAQTYEHNARIKWLGDQFVEQGNQFAQEAYSSGDPVDALAKLYEGSQVYEGVIPEAELIEVTKKAELAIVQSAIQGLTDAGRVDEAEALTERFFGARPPTASPVATAGGGDAMSVLRAFEGFRDTPYWDVNANRIGYGSDTITRADGSVVKVQKGMKITRADAERDLARRVKEFEGVAQGQVGAREWGALPGNVQSALVSVTYNYGELPASVVNAVKSGDVESIASAVEGLAGHNKGVNRERRQKEAAIIRGGAMPAAGSGGEGAILPNAEAASQNYAQIDRVRSQQNTQAKAQYDSHKGSLELGIETGDVAAPETILNDDILSDAHKADLLKALRTRQKDEIATRSALTAFGEGRLTVDPYSSDGKKAVDNVFGAISEAVPPEQLQAQTEEIVRQSGAVPQQVVNLIRRGATSKEVEDVLAAAQSAQRISTIDPAALGRRDGGSDAQKLADDFSYYVNRLNMSPEEAAQKIIDDRNPEKVFDRKALEPAAKEFLKEIEDFNLAGEFDESFLGLAGNPAIGFDEQQRAGIQAEFKSIAEEQFYKVNGDPELARNRAVEEMKRRYGVTELTGTSTIMKHPPEKHWPLLRIEEYGKTSFVGDSQSLDYARMQLRDDLAALDPEIDMDQVQLVTTPETDRMVKRGEMPGYAVLYRDKDGMLQTIPGQLWKPDVETAMSRQAVIEEREKAEREADARREQEIHRDEIERQEILDQRKKEAGQRMRGEEVTPAEPRVRSKPAPDGDGDTLTLPDDDIYSGAMP